MPRGQTKLDPLIYRLIELSFSGTIELSMSVLTPVHSIAVTWGRSQEMRQNRFKPFQTHVWKLFGTPCPIVGLLGSVREKSETPRLEFGERKSEELDSRSRLILLDTYWICTVSCPITSDSR